MDKVEEIINNLKLQDIVLIIVVVVVVYLLFRNNNCNENFDASNDNTEAMRNLGAISKEIMTNKGELTIPANKTIIGGNLLIPSDNANINIDSNGNIKVKGNITIDGKIITTNSEKIILLGCVFMEKYYGPILDMNGFSIPVTKYWCKQPLYLGKYSDYVMVNYTYKYECNNCNNVGPYLFANTDKNEWWIFSWFPSGNADKAFLFEFTPRSYFYSNMYLPNSATPLSSPAGYKNILERGCGVLTLPLSNDSSGYGKSIVYPKQNTKDPNPYYT